MQDNYSDQTVGLTSDESDRTGINLSRLDDENTASDPASGEVDFRSVMSQYEMEILTKLFPKCARTLAGVLRNRPY